MRSTRCPEIMTTTIRTIPTTTTTRRVD
jgi:hypothetical protein